MIDDPRALLEELFAAAVKAAAPSARVPPHLPPPPKGRTIVVGAGKASAAMARAVEDHWSGDLGPCDLEGLVVTRYGHAVPCRRIEIVEASHPTPDEAGLRAAERILDLAGGAGEDDLVLCLISGGGSALMSLPAPGLTLKDKQAVNRALLKSGATIAEMNCVRKHLSAIKGGWLAAAAAPARVVTLLISDVPGDDPDVIASGPTVPDPTSFADARAILSKYAVDPPVAVRDHLDRAERETPKPGNPVFAHAEVRMIATPQEALEAAATLARSKGVDAHILSDRIEGESRDVGLALAALARQVADRDQPFPAPCVLLSGGETTVTVRGDGRGGRNVEFLLSLATALGGHGRIWALAADTDGIDGTEDNAGAIATPDSLSRGATKGLIGKDRLEQNDGYGFFAALGDLVTTGPTLTNVNDFRAILVLPRSP